MDRFGEGVPSPAGRREQIDARPVSYSMCRRDLSHGLDRRLVGKGGRIRKLARPDHLVEGKVYRGDGARATGKELLGARSLLRPGKGTFPDLLGHDHSRKIPRNGK